MSIADEAAESGEGLEPKGEGHALDRGRFHIGCPGLPPEHSPDCGHKHSGRSDHPATVDNDDIANVDADAIGDPFLLGHVGIGREPSSMVGSENPPYRSSSPSPSSGKALSAEGAETAGAPRWT